MKRKKSFELKITSCNDENDDTDAAYLILPRHPGFGSQGVVERTEDLCTLVENYKGPEIYLDFDKDGFLIGIELLEDEVMS